MNKTIEVVAHWFNDSGDAEIVHIKALDKSRELKNDLFWFSGDNRPFFKPGTQLADEEFIKFKCYKQRTMQSIEEDIPDDCYMPL
ncbi:hypothetical protein HFC69_00285 [Pediococcus sp. EKM202D]|uniref:hypothetical protein n=1 Tax=unclassified Pediococcus TaxID=554805 RepID=UPI00142D7702|nr:MULTISPECIES: hypothetical protein [unclassified Pediococcus]KAF5440729.1 hypothetical protein HFC69_00285 [Pediococcus sp. EKM202D]KAF5441708.1 hypothetical protein HFC68_02595 [Pediococcus sp. EKM201D]